MSGSYGQGGLDDVFGPRPDRPTHPDFTRLVSTVLKLDGRMEAGGDFESTVIQYVDKESAVYMANQRALRMAKMMGVPEALITMFSALWIDGFIIGCDYTRRKDAGPHST